MTAISTSRDLIRRERRTCRGLRQACATTSAGIHNEPPRRDSAFKRLCMALAFAGWSKARSAPVSSVSPEVWALLTQSSGRDDEQAARGQLYRAPPRPDDASPLLSAFRPPSRPRFGSSVSRSTYSASALGNIRTDLSLASNTPNAFDEFVRKADRDPFHTIIIRL